MKVETGIVHGRFQLLHNDHMKYILAAMERCNHLIIGIANPDPTLTNFNHTAPHRSEATSNPFTFYERYKMIQGSLNEISIDKDLYDIVPFPINYPELLYNYIPQRATHYITIYDKWGLEKKALLEQYGYKVIVMWKKELSEKTISGTQIRQYIIDDIEWKRYVPSYVYNYVNQNKLYEIIKHGRSQ